MDEYQPDTIPICYPGMITDAVSLVLHAWLVPYVNRVPYCTSPPPYYQGMGEGRDTLHGYRAVWVYLLYGVTRDNNTFTGGKGI